MRFLLFWSRTSLRFFLWLSSYFTRKKSPLLLFKKEKVSDVGLGRTGLCSPASLGLPSKTGRWHWKWLLQGFSIQS